MKVELQCGDKITIPEGCKAIVKDGSVVFEKGQEFKDGDVLCSTLNDIILIFKETYNHARSYFNSHYNNKGSGNERWCIEFFRHATEEEKQLLFDKMKEQGLKWNAEEKRVEHIRWRAEEGEEYFSIDTAIQVCNLFEDNEACDNAFYNALNYFHTKEQAEEAARRVKEVLRKFHEEIGE